MPHRPIEEKWAEKLLRRKCPHMFKIDGDKLADGWRIGVLSDMLQDRTQHQRLTARPKDRTKAGRCRRRKDLRK